MLTYDAQRRTKTNCNRSPEWPKKCYHLIVSINISRLTLQCFLCWCTGIVIFFFHSFMLILGRKDIVCQFIKTILLIFNCLWFVMFFPNLLVYDKGLFVCFFFFVRLPQAILKYKPVKLKPQRIWHRSDYEWGI